VKHSCNTHCACTCISPCPSCVRPSCASRCHHCNTRHSLVWNGVQPAACLRCSDSLTHSCAAFPHGSDESYYVDTHYKALFTVFFFYARVIVNAHSLFLARPTCDPFICRRCHLRPPPYPLRTPYPSNLSRTHIAVASHSEYFFPDRSYHLCACAKASE
jgi:hypothetical protein